MTFFVKSSQFIDTKIYINVLHLASVKLQDPICKFDRIRAFLYKIKQLLAKKKKTFQGKVARI